MSVEAAIYDRLNGFAGLTAILATNGIYKDIVPGDAAEPAIAYQLISDAPIPALNVDTEWSVARIQITVVGGSQQIKVDIGQQIKLAMQRYTGVNATVTIGDVRLENINDLPYDHLTGEIARIIDLMVYYHE